MPENDEARGRVTADTERLRGDGGDPPGITRESLQPRSDRNDAHNVRRTVVGDDGIVRWEGAEAKRPEGRTKPRKD